MIKINDIELVDKKMYDFLVGEINKLKKEIKALKSGKHTSSHDILVSGGSLKKIRNEKKKTPIEELWEEM